MTTGQTFRDRRRVALWQARPFCSYCGRRVKRKRATMDHVVPRARGGTDELHNLTIACPECQAAKGDKTVAEWVNGILAGLAEFYVLHGIPIPDGWPFAVAATTQETS